MFHRNIETKKVKLLLYGSMEPNFFEAFSLQFNTRRKPKPRKTSGHILTGGNKKI